MKKNDTPKTTPQKSIRLRRKNTRVCQLIFLHLLTGVLLQSCVTTNIQKKKNHLTPPAELSKVINQVRLKHNVPGASIALIQDHKIAWLMPLGSENLKKKIPVTEKTLFEACSITKTLTSAVVLKELQRKNLSLQTEANQVLKRWTIPKHDYKSKVTIRALLDHSGGLSNPYPNLGKVKGFPKTTLKDLFMGKSPFTTTPLHVESPPGTYKYCNGCYSVLQMLVEDVSGKNYQTLVEEDIFRQLDMHHSTFDETLLESPIINSVATPYNEQHQPYPSFDRMPIYATGGLITTAKDLAKFILGFQDALLGKANTFISRQLAEDMVKPSSTKTRGLGFNIGDKDANDLDKGTFFFHSGQNIGYLTLLIGSKDGSVGAVILINISSPWDATDHPHFRFLKDTLRILNSYYVW